MPPKRSVNLLVYFLLGGLIFSAFESYFNFDGFIYNGFSVTILIICYFVIIIWGYNLGLKDV